MGQQGRTSHLLNKSLDPACRSCRLEASVPQCMILCVFMFVIISDDPSIGSTDDFMILIIRDCNVCKLMVLVEQIGDLAYTSFHLRAKR